jgi:hypothetical protein
MDAVKAVIPQVIFFNGRSCATAAEHRKMIESSDADRQSRKQKRMLDPVE